METATTATQATATHSTQPTTANVQLPTTAKADTNVGTSEATVDVSEQAKLEANNQSKQPEDFLELKVNGKVEKLSRDQAIRELQKERASQQRFQEAALLAKQANTFINTLKSNPLAALTELGVDIESLAEQRLADKARQANMSPEERAIAERDAKIAAYEKQLSEQKEAQERYAREQREHQAFQQFEENLMKTAQEFNLDADPSTFAELSQIALEFLENDEPLEPKWLAQEYQQRQEKLGSKYKGRIEKLSGDALLSELGPKLVESILKASVAKLQSSDPYKPKTESEQPQEPPEAAKDAKGMVRETAYLDWRKKNLGY